MSRVCTDQQDAGSQVGVWGAEEEAAAGLQQRARHLYVVMGKVRQQHLQRQTQEHSFIASAENFKVKTITKYKSLSLVLFENSISDGCTHKSQDD